MLRLKNLAVPLALLVGAVGGWLAASGQLASTFRAKAAAPAVAGKEGSCCDGDCRQQFVNAQDDKKDKKKPNILIIWGDDVGVHNVSAYTHGIMGYRTPHIDRLAKEGALFTDAYGEQSCTAGRAAFILGQHPFRTGLLTIGMPGSEHGIPDWAPTIADLLKPHGYMTAQFGKNHLGDRDKHLPTKHGFDEFFGNLYHLNAEEEPETYYYPKNPEFKRSTDRAESCIPMPEARSKTPARSQRSAWRRSTTRFISMPNPSSIVRSRTPSRSSCGSTPRACTSGPT